MCCWQGRTLLRARSADEFHRDPLERFPGSGPGAACAVTRFAEQTGLRIDSVPARQGRSTELPIPLSVPEPVAGACIPAFTSGGENAQAMNGGEGKTFIADSTEESS